MVGPYLYDIYILNFLAGKGRCDYCFTIQDTIKVHIFLQFMDKWQSEIYNMFRDFFRLTKLWIESKNNMIYLSAYAFFLWGNMI